MGTRTTKPRRTRKAAPAEGTTIGKAITIAECRALGTLDHTPVATDRIVDDLLAGYFGVIPKEVWANPTFYEDFEKLEPKMRVDIAIRLSLARLPKKATSDTDGKSWWECLEEAIRLLPPPTATKK